MTACLRKPVAQWRCAVRGSPWQELQERLRILMEQVRYTAAYLVDSQAAAGRRGAATGCRCRRPS